MRKIFLLAFTTALCACEPTKTQEYYMSRPEELSADLAACKQDGRNTFNCNEAAKADIFLKQKK